MTPQLTRLVRFFVVGASGVVVNEGLLILLQRLDFPLAVSSLIAIELSILGNFALNNAWTWHDRRTGTLGGRLLKYHVVAGFTSFCVNWSLLIFLTRFFGIDYRISNLIGIAAATVLNYILNHKWTFQKQPAGEDSAWQAPSREELKQLLTVRGISPNWSVTLLVLLAMALVLRIVAMAGMQLLPEEAYYWMYSQHPSLSYFDHPPMVAWLIWFGTQLFGNTEFGVRAGIALMMLASSGLIYVFSRMWFGREAALVSAALLVILPMYFGTGLMATMDSALLFFWLVCLIGTSVALLQNKSWGWYLAGLGLGGAILSKYTGIFLGLGALLAVIGYQPWRKHLRSVHPYAATLLAFAMFSPVIIWNSQHDWASFRFQFMNRFSDRSANVTTVGWFALWQLVVLTPLLLPGVIWLYARTLLNGRRLFTPRLLIALSFSLPLVMVMAYKSLKDDIHPNWTLPAFLSVFPAIAQLSLVLWRSRRKKVGWLSWQRAALTTATVCLTLNVLALTFALFVQPRTGLIPALRPWTELSAAVEKVEEKLKAETGQQPLIIGMDKYRLASVLAFYRTPHQGDMRASDSTTSQWILGGEGLGFPYWTTEEKWLGRDCIIVDDSEDAFTSRFKTFEKVDEIEIRKKTYYIYVGRGLHN